jgi:hypothetical protein
VFVVCALTEVAVCCWRGFRTLKRMRELMITYHGAEPWRPEEPV